MDKLMNLLNHNSNFTIVTNDDDDDGGSREVIATKSLKPGDVIGPSMGLSVDYVLDPIKILQHSNVAQRLLQLLRDDSSKIMSSTDRGNNNLEEEEATTDNNNKQEEQQQSQKRIDEEKMIYWIALAVMAQEAKERRANNSGQSSSSSGDEEETSIISQSKKRRKQTTTTTTHHQHSITSNEEQQQQQQQEVVYDAYLLSLPKEGPDPCSWSQVERTQLLHNTPLKTQVDTTLQQIEDMYNRIMSVLEIVEGGGGGGGDNDYYDTAVIKKKMPPLSINGRGIFPSILWARSMHISRSFPRSLIDDVEGGIWWQGRKRYVPPSNSSSSVVGEVKAAEEVKAVTEPMMCHETKNDDGETILSVRLGGYRAPIVTTKQMERPYSYQNEEEEEEGKVKQLQHHVQQQSPPSKEEEEEEEEGKTITQSLQSQHIPNNHHHPPPGSTLGVLLPLYDMIDHKQCHPVQWESYYNSTTHQRYIRFRNCLDTNNNRPNHDADHDNDDNSSSTIKKGVALYNNYGPKPNLELLATYGFTIRDNVFDSVEGIVLGMNIPIKEDNGNESSISDSDGVVNNNVYKAQLEYIQSYSIPHRFDNDRNVLLLGPFSLHRNLTSLEEEEEGIAADKEDDVINESNEVGGGIIPQELYKALSILGMEDVDEGPMISVDEMEILREVLLKKLCAFGGPADAATTTFPQTDNNGGGKKSSCQSTSNDQQQLLRAEFVEAYKDGQRMLLQLALSELESIMPPEDEAGGGDGMEDEDTGF